MKYLAVSFLTGVLLSACVHPGQPAHSSQDSLAASDSGAAKNTFFPVAEFLETEILAVDSMPLALKQFTIDHGKTDSVFLTVPQFNALALQFLPAEIRDNGLEKNFTESSFVDRATRSITFTYSPLDKNLQVQRVDVLTTAGVRAQQVKSVYLERSHVAGDSSILQKLYWRSGHSFQIVTMTRVKGVPPMEEQLRVVWNSDEADQ